MLTLEHNGFRIVQTGPRSYHAEHFEHGQWWRRSTDTLLDTYEGTVEEAMLAEFSAVVHPKTETTEELTARFKAEFGEDYPPPISSKEELMALWPGLRGR